MRGIVVDAGTGVALTIAAAAILFLGVVPGGMLDFAQHATQLLRSNPRRRDRLADGSTRRWPAAVQRR